MTATTDSTPVQKNDAATSLLSTNGASKVLAPQINHLNTLLKSVSSVPDAATSKNVFPSVRQTVLPTSAGTQLVTPIQLTQLTPIILPSSPRLPSPTQLTQNVAVRQVVSPVVTQSSSAVGQPAIVALSGAQLFSPLTFVAPGLQVISGFSQNGLVTGLSNSVPLTPASLSSNFLQPATVMPFLKQTNQTVSVLPSPINLQSNQQQFIFVSLPSAVNNSSINSVTNSANLNLS